MDYLQYLDNSMQWLVGAASFKPCYKWITFNIQYSNSSSKIKGCYSFKPCYKWITFNITGILLSVSEVTSPLVLNLVINGLPSIFMIWQKVTTDPTKKCFKPCYKWITFNIKYRISTREAIHVVSFKPCYKWITFNI